MKIGIMQPYFFPYLGYWQLMNAVDTYVMLDDVSFIKRGWINRNQIKGPNGPLKVDIQIRDISQNKNINEHTLFRDEKHNAKMFKTLEMCYHKAPYYADTMALIQRVMNCGEENLARFLAFGIREIARYLGMNTNFYFSSELEKDNSLKAQDRILEICSVLGADTYINAIGGRELYHAEDFEKRGMKLYFLKMDEDIVYEQGKGEFLPSLSIIDVMMYNSPKGIQELLNCFTLTK